MLVRYLNKNFKISSNNYFFSGFYFIKQDIIYSLDLTIKSAYVSETSYENISID